jgi:hypothetical protein
MLKCQIQQHQLDDAEQQIELLLALQGSFSTSAVLPYLQVSVQAAL